MNRIWKRIMIGAMAAVLMAGATPAGNLTAKADFWEIEEDSLIQQSSVSRGKIGKSMNLTFQIRNDSDKTWNSMEVEVKTDPLNGGNQDHEYICPLEKGTKTTVGGSLAPGKQKFVLI